MSNIPREELHQTQINRYLRSSAYLPQDEEDYDYDEYLDHLEDNLKGPMRQFRSAMLDLGNLMTADYAQRKVFRDVVFAKEKEMMALMDDWIHFYLLHSEAVKDSISYEFTCRPLSSD